MRLCIDKKYDPTYWKWTLIKDVAGFEPIMGFEDQANPSTSHSNQLFPYPNLLVH